VIARQELKLLRLPLLVLGITVVLAAAMIWGSRAHEQRERAAAKSARERLEGARAQLARVNEEARALSRYAPLRSRFEAGHARLTEDRLAWMEAMKNAALRLRISELEYEFGPTQILAPETRVGDRFFHGTPMSLKTRLWHEGELVGLLDDLAVQAPGRFTLQNCTLNRQASPIQGVGHELLTDCRLIWLTLRQKETAEKKP
jgi:hypothetical protein